MVKVYAATRSEYRTATQTFWQYGHGEAVGATVLQACRRIDGFYRLLGYACWVDGAWGGGGWNVRRYRCVPMPTMELKKASD
jgi:hypothetical protein